MEHRCICESPYLGCQPIDQPTRCERCGGLVETSAEELANMFASAMLANLREASRQRELEDLGDGYGEPKQFPLNGVCCR